MKYRLFTLLLCMVAMIAVSASDAISEPVKVYTDEVSFSIEKNSNMKSTEKLSIEVAAKDVAAWLNHKKVSEKKREAYQDQIDQLTEAVMEGHLVYDPDKHTLIQNLKFPIESESPVSKLEFKPRIRVKDVHQQLNGVKSTDADGRLTAYIAALTGHPKGVILNLDTDDYSIGQNIAIFFL